MKLILNGIRFLALCNLIALFTTNTILAVAVGLGLTLVLAIQDLRQIPESKTVELEEIEEIGSIEELQAEDPLIKIVTEVADEIVCKYMDKEWPAWIEVNETDYFMFDGPQEIDPKDIEAGFLYQPDEDTLIIAPGVAYKRMTADNADELAKILGVPVEALTS